MADQARKRDHAKDILTRAIICEQKRMPNNIWTSILIVVYAPMLINLRKRVRGNALAGDDIDQLVLSEFFAGVQEFPLNVHTYRTCMHLRQDTRRRLLKSILQEQAEIKNRHNLEALIDIDHNIPLCGNFQHPDDILDDPSVLAGTLVEFCADDLKEKDIDLIKETYFQDKSIRDYIKEERGRLSEPEENRLYQRYKRRRTRAIEKIKARTQGFNRKDLRTIAQLARSRRVTSDTHIGGVE